MSSSCQKRLANCLLYCQCLFCHFFYFPCTDLGKNNYFLDIVTVLHIPTIQLLCCSFPPRKYYLVVSKSPAYQILHCIVTLGFIFASYVLLYLLLFLSLAVLCCLDQRQPSSFLPLLLLSSSLDYSPVDSWFILLLSIYVRVLHFDELLHQFLQKVFFWFHWSQTYTPVCR